MIRADYDDKEPVIDILVNSFGGNKSVSYIIKQGQNRVLRLKRLMAYSFEICYRYGKVFLSNNKKGCALIILPEKKKTTGHMIQLCV